LKAQFRWLCYRHGNQIFVAPKPGASFIHARIGA